MQGVALTAVDPRPVGALVERQEQRVLLGKQGGDIDVVLVRREVHHRAGAEDEIRGVALLPVLPDRIVHVLPGGLGLQLGRGQRDAVHEQHQVDRRRGVGLGVVNLPGHAEAIGAIQLAQLWSEVVGRREVGQVEVDPEVLDAPAQHVDHAA